MKPSQRDVKNAKITALLVGLMRAGVPVRDAFDLVLGAGAYERMASDLYDALRARELSKSADGCGVVSCGG